MLKDKKNTLTLIVYRKKFKTKNIAINQLKNKILL